MTPLPFAWANAGFCLLESIQEAHERPSIDDDDGYESPLTDLSESEDDEPAVFMPHTTKPPIEPLGPKADPFPIHNQRSHRRSSQRTIFSPYQPTSPCFPNDKVTKDDIDGSSTSNGGPIRVPRHSYKQHLKNLKRVDRQRGQMERKGILFKGKEVVAKHLQRCAEFAVATGSNLSGIPQSTWIGDRRQRAKKGLPECESISDAQEMGLELVEWDFSSVCPILDREGKVVALAVGPNIHPEWMNEVIVPATDLVERTVKKHPVNPRKHRRGRYGHLSFGISYGGGQKIPMYLSNRKRRKKVIQEVTQSPHFKRIVGRTAQMMNAYAPELYAHAQDVIEMIELDSDKTGAPLRRPFPGSPFAAASLNTGPDTWTLWHTDMNNEIINWCAITSLGQFDYTKGGHLLLRELGIMLPFPPGATILIPSSLIMHSNIPISAGEIRYSFVQYTAGGLAQWVAHGCKPAKASRCQAPPSHYFSSISDLISSASPTSDV